MDYQSNNSLPFSDQLDITARTLSLIGIGAYFSGLLITHIFLASHGFFLFQLLKVDYIFVGGLWLSFLAIAYIWIGALLEQFQGKSRPKISELLTTGMLFIGVYLFLMGLISVFSVDEVKGLSDAHLLYTCGVFLGQAISVHIMVFLYRGWKFGSTPRKGTFSLLLILTLVVFILFLSVYYRYAIDIYPLYPRILGGGRPAVAQLVLPEDSWDTAEVLGLKVDSAGLTPFVYLLYETSDAYFVLTEEGKGYGIKIAASEVSYVIYRSTGPSR
jgi:hypothetical protein